MSRRLAEGMQGGTHTDAAPAVDAVVALGANLGDRHETLAAAAAAPPDDPPGDIFKFQGLRVSP